MGRGPGWTADETATLFRLLARNATWSEIASAVGRTVASCKNKLAQPSRHPQGSVEIAEVIKLREIKRPRWSPETEAELIRLREVERLTWLDIDAHFGREHGTCSDKYHKLKQGAVSEAEASEPAARVINPHWTTENMTIAETRWRELFINVHGENPWRSVRYPVFEIIGREIGRTASAVESRLRTHGPTFGRTPSRGPIVKVVQASATMTEARARWAAQARQDPCARLMGDPPPGYSALDQRRQACTGAPRDSR